MKKMIYILLFISLVAILPQAAIATDKPNVKLNSNELLEQLGFSKEELNDLKKNPNRVGINGFKKKDILRYAQLGYSKQQILDFNGIDINYLDGMEGELIGIDSKFMKITKEGTVELSKQQYDEEVAAYHSKKNKSKVTISAICDTSTSTCPDSEPTSNWMYLSSRISRISGTSPQEYIIVHDFTWTKQPFYTYKDAVGIAHHSSMSPIQNSEYLKYSVDKYRSSNSLGPWSYKGVDDRYYWSANDKTGGIGFEFSLSDSYCYGGWCYKYENHEGTVAYRVFKNSSSAIYGDFSGHYIHTEESYSPALGLDVTGTGSFSIQSSISQDPAIQTGVTFKF
jgi:hypothetical protein